MANTKPINIRLDDKLNASLHHAVEKSGVPLADVIRFALSLGLKDLALINYKIADAIHDRVMLEKSRIPPELEALPDAAKPSLRKKA